MIIGSEYHFSAAHYLTCVPEGHQCRRLHGHNYKVIVEIEGEVDDATGMVMDFADLDAIIDPIIDRLDHQCLNHVLDIEPTAENLATYIGRRMSDRIDDIAIITIYETPTKFARTVTP